MTSASAQGWVQSVDPSSGRTFYANHITRKTQWDPPEGWKEPSTTTPLASNLRKKDEEDEENEPLPANWERMVDPTTGKPFYIDHERKITQWTRPKAVAAASNQLQPAAAAVPLFQTNRNRNTTQSHRPTPRSYQQEMDYYYSSQPTSQGNVDLSDTMPPLEFKVETVSDALRPQCSHCQSVFSLSKRRHHCRLCGDVFCDACSNHRCAIPLPEYGDKPVRVCDYCFVDVERGNFFSLRRYWTVLHLYQPGMEEVPGSVATAANVNAALSGLTQDLDQMVAAADRLEETWTIPAATLVPEILKHLSAAATADRAMRCIAALLSLESIAGQSDFAVAIYLYGKKTAVDDILAILERSGSSRKTLFVQEQAARTLYYLTESKLMAAVTRSRSELQGSHEENDLGTVEEGLDIPRAIRNLLDHASSTNGNPNLQRWAAATLKNLILEDQRRACLAVNEMAAVVASGERPAALTYKSHLPELVATGGVMILGSLIGADDADTRAHAVTALGATLQSTRAVSAALQALGELSGGEYGRTLPNDDHQDGDIVRAMVAAGGCAGSVAQLLLSADHSVAGMGCQFLSSLVRPLLVDVTILSEPISSQYEYDRDPSSVGAYREAAIEIATGSCLPALLSLVRETNGKSSKRPVELRWIAMEALTATIVSIGDMGRAWAAGQYEEGLERFGAPTKLKEAIIAINEEDIVDCALQILQSATLGQSLGTTAGKETPATRIRECAGMVLSSITSCSAEAITNVQSRNILSSLLLASTDSTMTTTSTIRGDGSPRCLGVLETVSSLAMFSWQHPSGSEKDLLDTLIEMIDAGAIPYLSRVLRAKVDWESKDKAIGGMKARAACCRLLCCLFGIALTDSTGIGMRRLMDAVESDATSYRLNDPQRKSNDNRRVATNIIEATLGTLQTSSNLARMSLIGGGSQPQGRYYSAAVMDLVETSLLAVGSMCGSSIAPGGSEGTLITGESFLQSRSDSYISRRQDICNVACDVVVRGGRGEPTLLPTMVVGGFGEGSVLASLRLALAIAQNGTKEQHTKLASSGILVPISDLLRSALSRGDIYKFSSSLALVRFCGPYVAAGQGGGIESVRDAIRVATNVLTLPVNPGATLKQMETQETLKSECIAALEALSRNASLWSSISTDALPAMVKYIYSSASDVGPAAMDPRGNATKCAALRAVLQIVQVPSHAVSAAEAGIVGPLGQLLLVSSDNFEIPMLALEVLHVIAVTEQARRKAGFIESGILRAICASISKSLPGRLQEPSASQAAISLLGLEILHFVLREIEGDTPMELLLQSSAATIFLASIESDPLFIRALCSTLLVKTGMKLPRHDDGNNGESEFDVPNLYGPPIPCSGEKCAGFDNTQEAAEALLFTTAVYACALSTQPNDGFWSIALLENVPGNTDRTDAMRTSAVFSAQFLSLLAVDHKAFVPKNARRHEDFLTITRPLVRHRLLEALRDSMSPLSSEVAPNESADPFLTSVLVVFNVPHICLSLWRDPALLDLAFDLIKEIVERDPDEVLHLFVKEKAAILSLFELLNLDSAFDASTNVTEIRRFLATVLGQLADSGLFADAVQQFDVRSSAIAALASACLSEEQRPPDEDEDMTSNQLSSVLMRCLVELCSGKGAIGRNDNIKLTSTEAEAIATSLGRKLCQMVLTRFLERTKLKQYEMDEDDTSILDAPDVAMLCAIAQHDEALKILRSIGGLHALSLIAAEGKVSALVALKKACDGNADVLLEGNTYLALMSLITSKDHDAGSRSDSPTWRELECSAYDLLTSLCSGSTKGRNVVAAANTCESCVSRAVDIVTDLVEGRVPSVADELSALSTEDADAADTPTNGHVTSVAPDSELEQADIVLGVAACGFLSALAAVTAAHKSLCKNEEVVCALAHLATSSKSEDLRFAALNVIVSYAPYVADEAALTACKVGEVLLAVLSSQEKYQATPKLNTNQVHYAAVCGVTIVCDLLDHETQEKAAGCVTAVYLQSVRSCVVSRSAAKEEDRAYAADLSFALTSTLLSFVGKSFVHTVFTNDIVTSLVHMVQWRYDPKTVLLASEKQMWDASVVNCLLLLSSILWKPDAILSNNGIKLDALANTTLMLARPGKAPRKAMDVKSALNCAIGGSDAGAAVAATRVLCRLFR